MSDLFDAELLAENTTEAERPRTRQAARQERAARRRRRHRRAAVAIVIALLIVAGLGYGAFIVLRPLLEDTGTEEVSDYQGPGHGEVQVTISEGDAGRDIGATLADADVVATPRAFIDAFSAHPDGDQIQPGTYTVPMELPAADAVAALLDPANKSELRITVPEGWQASQVYERVSNVAQIPLEEVEAAADDVDSLGLPDQADGEIEGWLGAATYTFETDADAEEILSAMIDKTTRTLDELNVTSDEQQRVLTIASIVEREAFTSEVYGKVARVILNRLDDTDEVDGLLQMDSTVLYGVGKTGGMPTSDDLDDDNPYNTYQESGLPPTPIGSPGPEVLEATVNPPEGDWLYFVTVDLDTGETLFTGDHEEHERNREQLQEWLEDNPLPEDEETPRVEDGGK